MPADEQEETPGFTVGGFPSYKYAISLNDTLNAYVTSLNDMTLTLTNGAMGWGTMASAGTVTFNTLGWDQYRIRALAPDNARRDALARLEQERVYAAQARGTDRERLENWRRERDEANRRARIVLYSFLTAEQIECYEDEERFYIAVEGSLGTQFRVRNGSAEGNICVMSPSSPNRQMGRVCAHPGGELPQCDQHLGQMFALQADERAFLDRANIYEGPSMCYVDDRIFDIYAEDAQRPRFRNRVFDF